MARATVRTIMCRGAESPILNCIGTVREVDFYNSWSKLERSKVCYCKKCCDLIFKYYKDKGYDDKASLYFTLQKIDIPFIKDIYNTLTNKNKEINVKNYLDLFYKKENKMDIWTDFSATNINMSELNKSDLQQNIIIKSEELEKKWGVQDFDKDYQFLEDTFKKYTNGVNFSNPMQIDLYKDLCRDRLLLRKINDGRYKGEETIDKVQNRISRTMSTLKVDQFEEKKARSLSEQLIFNKIAQIELTKPADLYKEPTKYKDFNKVRKYYQDICLRPLKNTLAGMKDFDIDVDSLGDYDLKKNEEK